MSLSLNDRQIWASLMAVDGIGSKTFQRISNFVEKNGICWADWWAGEEFSWHRCRLSEQQQHAICTFQQQCTPEAYYGWLKEQAIEVICYTDKNYPDLLQNIDTKPILLYSKNPQLRWNQLPIGVVGTRKISGYGRQVTAQLTTQLVVEGATIVSGFMYGVDETAHRSAVAAGGYTVGVLGYGFQHVYPQEFKQLYEEVLANGGSFITEYAPHVRPNQGTFPQRNRIIAGMSQAVVVIEAGLRSGSHITVDRALEYGRVVCAVPGPITNPYSEGTRWQLNQGATLVSSGQDIVRAISDGSKHTSIDYLPTFSPSQVSSISFEHPVQQQLFERLKDAPSSLDELVWHVQQAPAMVQSALTELEIEGVVKRCGATWIIR